MNLHDDRLRPDAMPAAAIAGLPYSDATPRFIDSKRNSSPAMIPSRCVSCAQDRWHEGWPRVTKETGRLWSPDALTADGSKETCCRRPSCSPVELRTSGSLAKLMRELGHSKRPV
jgi:DNA-directed RNA polymerase subunit N (RpoN/RPB10)